MAVEYKFKPYTPQNLKLATPQASLTQQEKTRRSLEKQRENLDARLRAEGIDPGTLGGDFDNRNLIEKALNLKPDQGFLMDFFEIINRPVEAVKGALSAGVSGENILEGAWEGISGQETISGSELLKQTTGIEPETKVGKFIADVGTDILLDPLTYLPAGFFIKGFKKLTNKTEKIIINISSETQERLAQELFQEYGENFLEKAALNPLDDRVFLKGETAQYLSGKARTKFNKETGRTIQKEVVFLDSVRWQEFKKGLKIDSSIAAEFEAVEHLKPIFDGLGNAGDYEVIATVTSNHLDDVIILKKVDGTKYYTKVGSVDSKFLGQRLGGAVKTTSSTFKVGKNAGGREVLEFGSGTKMAKKSAEVQEQFFNSIRNIRTKNGGNLSDDILNLIKKGRGEKGTNTINLFKNTPVEEHDKLRRLLVDFSKQNDVGLLYVTDLSGDPNRWMFFDFEEVLDNLDWSESAFEITKSNGVDQFRLFPRIKVDVAAIQESGKFFMPEDLGRMFGQYNMEVNLTLIDRLSQKTGLLGSTGKALQKTKQTIKSFFNLTGDFTDSGKLAFKQIEGQAGVFMQRQSARLASLQKQIIQKYPDSGKYISELFEAGAYLDEATGTVKTMARDYGTEDFLGYVRKRVSDGVDIPIPQFADEAMKLNFSNYMNDLADRAIGIDDMFQVVTQNGATGLKFTGTDANLKEIMTYFKTFPPTDAYIHFGTKRLSKEAEALMRNAPEELKQLNSLMDDVLGTLVKEGGFDNLAPELAGKIGYMRHMMTKGAYESLQLTAPGVASKFAKPGMDVLSQRTFLGSIDEVNAALKEFYKLDMDLFDPNAFNAMENLIKVTGRKVEQSKMLDLILNSVDNQGNKFFKVVDNTQVVRKELAPNQLMVKSFEEEFSALFKNLSPSSQTQLKATMKQMGFAKDKALVLNRSAHGILKRVEKAYIDLPQFVKTYDNFLNFWKGSTLISPGFHLRNLFGNSFNSYAVGMDLAAQSKYGLIAMKELDTYNQLLKKIAEGGTLSVAEEATFKTVKQFMESGLVQSHRGVRDLEMVKEAVEEALQTSTLGSVKKGYNNLVRFNFNVAEKIDDVQRYMLFRWSMDKTGDIGKASRTVSEALFDYSHLTAFEKDVMKRVFPFYTFMKNNFIFQAKNIFNNPKAYARTGRAYKYYLEDISGYGPDDLPDYATENMWIPLPITVTRGDKDSIAFLKANLPLSDFTELVENPFKKGVTSISAPIKLPIELGIGRDLFTGAPLTAFPGERNRLASGEGVFSYLRDERGSLAATQNPVIQKIANELGLRTFLNAGTIGLDIFDTLAGYQGPKEGLADFTQRLGLTGVQTMDNIELTELYQDLERLRELKKYYEQETGNQLPPLR
jgi:hypothetical protein